MSGFSCSLHCANETKPWGSSRYFSVHSDNLDSNPGSSGPRARVSHLDSQALGAPGGILCSEARLGSPIFAGGSQWVKLWASEIQGSQETFLPGPLLAGFTAFG